jgi:hypothetical protein
MTQSAAAVGAGTAHELAGRLGLNQTSLAELCLSRK